MPHNEDVAEHEDTTEHGKDAAQALSLSLMHGAKVAAGNGEQEWSHSTPTTLEHHQMVLSFSSFQPANTPALPFSHPASTTIPTRKESVQCALCIQALSWCKCNHPPFVGKKKVRWLEAEVKHRIALLEAGQGSNHA
ncbi:hypothetical protein L208DRAFT_1420080 [Tricholoma matsutake]|nr:hypothetical protein L208DRAFT_1420080 [Tricholoma matsutake 945]